MNGPNKISCSPIDEGNDNNHSKSIKGQLSSIINFDVKWFFRISIHKILKYLIEKNLNWII